MPVINRGGNGRWIGDDHHVSDIRWDPGLRYRAFVDRPAGAATVVSSCLVDDSDGVALNGLVLVVDERRVVCDLELRDIAGSARPAAADLPADECRLFEPLRTSIDSTACVPEILLDEDWLVVNFEPAPDGAWYRLGVEDAFLRLAGRRLLAIAVADPQEDANGTAESAWLDACRTRVPGGSRRPAIARPWPGLLI